MVPVLVKLRVDDNVAIAAFTPKIIFIIPSYILLRQSKKEHPHVNHGAFK